MLSISTIIGTSTLTLSMWITHCSRMTRRICTTAWWCPSKSRGCLCQRWRCSTGKAARSTPATCTLMSTTHLLSASLARMRRSSQQTRSSASACHESLEVRLGDGADFFEISDEELEEKSLQDVIDRIRAGKYFRAESSHTSNSEA